MSWQAGRKPFLLLDVDGVINVLGPGPPGEATFTVAETAWGGVSVATRTPDRMRRLTSVFEVFWATAWGGSANGPFPSLWGAEAHPVLRLIEDDYRGTWKLPSIRRFVEDMFPGHPVAWADDDIGPDAYEWASGIGSGILLCEVNPRVGLDDEVLDRLIAFAKLFSNPSSGQPGEGDFDDAMNPKTTNRNEEVA